MAAVPSPSGAGLAPGRRRAPLVGRRPGRRARPAAAFARALGDLGALACTRRQARKEVAADESSRGGGAGGGRPHLGSTLCGRSRAPRPGSHRSRYRIAQAREEAAASSKAGEAEADEEGAATAAAAAGDVAAAAADAAEAKAAAAASDGAAPSTLRKSQAAAAERAGGEQVRGTPAPGRGAGAVRDSAGAGLTVARGGSAGAKLNGMQRAQLASHRACNGWSGSLLCPRRRSGPFVGRHRVADSWRALAQGGAAGTRRGPRCTAQAVQPSGLLTALA